jgi:hypothetical protein
LKFRRFVEMLGLRTIVGKHSTWWVSSDLKRVFHSRKTRRPNVEKRWLKGVILF